MTILAKSLAQGIGVPLATAGVIAATWTIAGAQEQARKFTIHEAPKPVAAIQFQDGQGQSRSLADFRGKVVLLNIWATWCVPCRKEMPALDRLKTALGDPDFEVATLSIDRGGMDVVRKFFAEVGIQELATYLDSSGKAMRELGVVGLPTTLIIDREGHEIGRLIGPAEWDAPDMIEFVSCVISNNGALKSPGALAATPLCGRGGLGVSTNGTNRQQ
jgi:thiol-disulfide isomerase/thioredoxin